MRSLAEFELVWALIDLGFNDCEVSRLTAVSRSTIGEASRRPIARG